MQKPHHWPTMMTKPLHLYNHNIKQTIWTMAIEKGMNQQKKSTFCQTNTKASAKKYKYTSKYGEVEKIVIILMLIY